MKPYLLFSFDVDPIGGWNDFVGDFETLALAIEAAAKARSDHWQIVDILGLSIVSSSGGKKHGRFVSRWPR